jgi:hypothetical protein
VQLSRQYPELKRWDLFRTAPPAAQFVALFYPRITTAVQRFPAPLRALIVQNARGDADAKTQLLALDREQSAASGTQEASDDRQQDLEEKHARIEQT